MKRSALGFGFAFGAAALLASAAAGAAPTKGDTGGKGGTGPDSSTKSGAEGTASTPSEVDTSQLQFRSRSGVSPDEVSGAGRVEKPWDVSATYELHRLIRQEDVAGATRLFQLLGVTGRYMITSHDTISLFGGVTQGFLADNGETGVRANDVSLQYAHVFDLPVQLRLRVAAGSTIPISYFSQLAANYSTPFLSLGLSRRFGDLSLSASIRGAYFIDGERESAPMADASQGTGGGDPNTRFVLGEMVSAEYDMPFHRPLSVGLTVANSDYWYYNPQGLCPSGGGIIAATGGAGACPATQDPQFGSSQPMQQSYGGELFVRYVMPDVAGIKSDFTVAFGNSTPNFVLHDGVVHPYLLYRDTAEVYFALSGRY
jgi:hypothetical protein